MYHKLLYNALAIFRYKNVSLTHSVVLQQQCDSATFLEQTHFNNKEKT